MHIIYIKTSVSRALELGFPYMRDKNIAIQVYPFTGTLG